MKTSILGLNNKDRGMSKIEKIEHLIIDKDDKGNISVLSTPSSSLSIRIADITFTIISVDPGLKLTTEEETRKFLVHETNPDIAIEVRWDDLSTKEAQGKKIFNSGGVWQLYQRDENFIFRFGYEALGSIPYKIAHVRKDFTRGEISLHKKYFDTDQPIYPLEYPLDQIVFINFLTLGKGVEIHACGLVDFMGRGHLFVGQSGSGKTTMARLWQDEPNVTILSDDRIVLRKLGEEIWMFGTPWHGESRFASTKGVPLKRIYFLSHGQKNDLVRQEETRGIARLLACSFLPFYSPEAINFALGFFEEVVRAASCYELRFLPNKEVLEFIMKNED
jgi:hypothetical protein